MSRPSDSAPRAGDNSPGTAAGENPQQGREPGQDERAPLHLTAASTAADATMLRRQFSAWLDIDVDPEFRGGIVLAVYEALANVTEHAYSSRQATPGPVHLTARRFVDAVLITVADEGAWQTPDAGGFRGRGLALMRELLDDVQVESKRGGTVVRLRAAVNPSQDTSSGPRAAAGRWPQL